MSHDQLFAYCKELKEAQERKEELEAQVSDLNKHIDVLRTDKIPNMMTELNLKNVTFEGFGRVSVQSDVYASTKEGMKEAGIQWLRDCGYEGMITQTYNMSSVKALFRGMLRDGSEIPSNIFNITPFQRASITKV